MNIPEKIILVGTAFFYDGGTMVLRAITATGEHLQITLNQRSFDSSQSRVPGQLIFKGEIVDVRSIEENRIIHLLKNAKVAFSPFKEPLTPIPEYKVLENNALIRSFCDHIIAFVESAEYVNIAKNGLPTKT